jgi:hypothetical protein
VILKVISTNICGSDQHMVRGRTTAPAGMVLGHEITGEVIEKGADVEMVALGDLVSVPFNVARGRCRACRETNTGVYLTVNPWSRGGRLSRLRGFADFQGVRSLFINEIDKKVFTTSDGVGDGGSGDFGRRLGGQLEREALDQELEFRLGLGVTGQQQLASVGRRQMKNFSSALRAVSPGAKA